MLITKSDITTRRDIASTVKEVKVNEFIRDAEFEDLRPLLGNTFYNAIVKTPADYSDLLDGSEYTYDDETYTHPGLKAVLIDYSYARYLMFGGQTDTAFGFVEKQFQDGQQVDRSGRKERYKSLQQSAYALWLEVKLFLDRNYTDYPLWNSSKSTQNGTFRISKVSI